MTTIRLTYIIIFLITMVSCNWSGEGIQNNPKEEKPVIVKKICSESSEWKNHDGPDYCPYYSDKEACGKILGKLNMISRLHKGATEEGVFEGGVSSRWFEIKKHSIVYFLPSGEIADRGTASAKTEY